MRPVLLLLSAMLLIGCGGSGSGDPAPTVIERGDRLLGIDLLDLAEANTFDDNLNHAARFGCDFIALHLAWTQIETSPGNFTDPDGSLAALAAVCQAEGLQFSLTLRPIDLTGKTVPADLTSTRFNDPQMATRFNAMVDFVLTKVPADILVSLQVGNEIDGYDTSAEHADFWSDYGAFLTAVNGHLDSVAPSVPTGFTVTLDGVAEEPFASNGVFQALDDAVDVVGVTYYPLNDDFTVRSPAGVQADIDGLVARFPGKTIFMQEVGYPSSATCASSEAMQAAFVRAFFAAWDRHPSTIRSASFVRLNDKSPADALSAAGPYGISSPAFVAYLETLGLRDDAGTGSDKEGFTSLEDAAIARGWTAATN